MATFALTASAADSLIGADSVADLFVLGTAGHLVGTDTVLGGSGTGIDILRISTGMVLAAAAFANTRGIERIEIAGGATNLTLSDAMVASRNTAAFEVVGGVGNDVISGLAVLATPLIVSGGGGNDVINGGGGNDSLAGDLGNDFLRAGTGADTLRGGDGADTLSLALTALDDADRLDGGVGTDVLLLASGGVLTAARYAGVVSGIERIVVTAALAEAVSITLPVTLSTGGATMTIAGALGADTINATGTQVAYVMDGGGANDRLFGGALADSLAGGADNDVLGGNGGNDTLDGGAGNDRLVGGLGNDLLLGGAGDDVLTGNAGDDTLDPGAGTDRADGGAGNDLYRVAATDLTSLDLISDESGAADALVIRDVFDTLAGAFAGFSFSGGVAGRVQGIERFEFGSGNDVFLPGNTTGDSAGANVVTVSGGAGNDLLNVSQVVRLITPLAFLLDGGEGSDSLVGGRGADTLSPGSGNDRAFGGLGDDVFLVLSDDFTAADTIAGEAGINSLRFIGNAPIGAEAFANVSGIQLIDLDEGGQEITVPGAYYNSLGGTNFIIRGGAGDDRIDVSSFANAPPFNLFDLGEGNDTFLGGADSDQVLAGPGADEIFLGTGADFVTFLAGQLSALDIVQADTTEQNDTLTVRLAAGETLAQGAFAGISGIDTFAFTVLGDWSAAVRLPSNIVSQSGQASVNINMFSFGGVSPLIVDGRGVTSGMRMLGDANDIMFGGSGADTITGDGGSDTLIGGPGGDRIILDTNSSGLDIALLRAQSDGTADINSTVNIAGADSVSGTEFAGNYIMADVTTFGFSSTFTRFVSSGGSISLANSASVLPASYAIAGDAFGSLTAIRNAVGARLTDNDARAFDKTILVIAGASNTRFGVYYFEDRDGNATVDSLDILRLLAIGTGPQPQSGEERGFALTSAFELL
jgi:Ca2+-binding RTX toxin-like protein